MGENQQETPLSEQKNDQFIYDDIDDTEIFTTAHHSKDEELDLQPDNDLIEKNRNLTELVKKQQKENELLKLRISQLYVTAKTEIDRKDQHINELKIERENFRRTNRNQYTRNDRSPKSRFHKDKIEKNGSKSNDQLHEKTDHKYDKNSQSEYNSQSENFTSTKSSTSVEPSVKTSVCDVIESDVHTEHVNLDRANLEKHKNDQESSKKCPNDLRQRLNTNYRIPKKGTTNDNDINKSNRIESKYTEKMVNERRMCKKYIRDKRDRYNNRTEHTQSHNIEYMSPESIKHEQRYYGSHSRVRGRKEYHVRRYSRSRSRSLDRDRTKFPHHRDRSRSKSHNRHASRHDSLAYYHKNNRRSRSLSRERPNQRNQKHLNYDKYNKCERIKDRRYSKTKEDFRDIILKNTHEDLPDNVKATTEKNIQNKVSVKDTESLYSEEDEIKLYLSGESDFDDNTCTKNTNQQNLSNIANMSVSKLERLHTELRYKLSAKNESDICPSPHFSEDDEIDYLDVHHSYLGDYDYEDVYDYDNVPCVKENRDEMEYLKKSYTQNINNKISDHRAAKSSGNYKKKKRIFDGNDTESDDIIAKKLKEDDTNCKKVQHTAVPEETSKIQESAENINCVKVVESLWEEENKTFVKNKCSNKITSNFDINRKKNIANHTNTDHKDSPKVQNITLQEYKQRNAVLKQKETYKNKDSINFGSVSNIDETKISKEPNIDKFTSVNNSTVISILENDTNTMTDITNISNSNLGYKMEKEKEAGADIIDQVSNTGHGKAIADLECNVSTEDTNNEINNTSILLPNAIFFVKKDDVHNQIPQNANEQSGQVHHKTFIKGNIINNKESLEHESETIDLGKKEIKIEKSQEPKNQNINEQASQKILRKKLNSDDENKTINNVKNKVTEEVSQENLIENSSIKKERVKEQINNLNVKRKTTEAGQNMKESNISDESSQKLYKIQNVNIKNEEQIQKNDNPDNTKNMESINKTNILPKEGSLDNRNCSKYKDRDIVKTVKRDIIYNKELIHQDIKTDISKNMETVSDASIMHEDGSSNSSCVSNKDSDKVKTVKRDIINKTNIQVLKPDITKNMESVSKTSIMHKEGPSVKTVEKDVINKEKLSIKGVNAEYKIQNINIKNEQIQKNDKDLSIIAKECNNTQNKCSDKIVRIDKINKENIHQDIKLDITKNVESINKTSIFPKESPSDSSKGLKNKDSDKLKTVITDIIKKEHKQDIKPNITKNMESINKTNILSKQGSSDISKCLKNKDCEKVKTLKKDIINKKNIDVDRKPDFTKNVETVNKISIMSKEGSSGNSDCQQQSLETKNASNYNSENKKINNKQLETVNKPDSDKKVFNQVWSFLPDEITSETTRKSTIKDNILIESSGVNKNSKMITNINESVRELKSTSSNKDNIADIKNEHKSKLTEQFNRKEKYNDDTLKIEAAKTLCSLATNQIYEQKLDNKKNQNLESKSHIEKNQTVNVSKEHDSESIQRKLDIYRRLEQELYISDSDEDSNVCSNTKNDSKENITEQKQKCVIISDISLKLSQEDLINLQLNNESGHSKSCTNCDISESIEEIKKEINTEYTKKPQRNARSNNKEDSLNTSELQRCLEEDNTAQVTSKSKPIIKRRASSRLASINKCMDGPEERQEISVKIAESARQVKDIFNSAIKSSTASIAQQSYSKSSLPVAKRKKPSFTELLLEADNHIDINLKSKNRREGMGLYINKNGISTGKTKNAKCDSLEAPKKNPLENDDFKGNVVTFCNSLTYIPSKNPEIPFGSPESFINKSMARFSSKKVPKSELVQKVMENVTQVQKVPQKTGSSKKIKKKCAPKEVTVTKSTRKTTMKRKTIEEETAQNKSSWKIRLADSSKRRNRHDTNSEDSKRKKRKTNEESDDELQTESPRDKLTDTGNEDYSGSSIDTKIERTIFEDKHNEGIRANQEKTDNISGRIDTLESNADANTVVSNGKTLKRITPKRIGECTKSKKNSNVKAILFAKCSSSTVIEQGNTNISEQARDCIKSSVVNIEESTAIELKQKSQPTPNSSPLASFENLYLQANLKKHSVVQDSTKAESSKPLTHMRASEEDEITDIHIDPITLLENKEIDIIISDLNISDKHMALSSNSEKNRNDKVDHNDGITVDKKDVKSKGSSLDFLNILSKNTSTPIKNQNITVNKDNTVSEQKDSKVQPENVNTDASEKSDLSIPSNTSSDTSSMIRNSIIIGVPLKRDRKRRAVVKVMD